MVSAIILSHIINGLPSLDQLVHELYQLTFEKTQKNMN